jgi:hypothetical protein
MSVVEPSQPTGGQVRWMLLFEMLTIDSLPIAALWQRGAQSKWVFMG